MKFIFCIEINIKVSYKLILSVLVVVARHAQRPQNNNFGIYLQYLKKEGRDEVDCLHEGKRQSSLQVDTVVFGQIYPKCLK